MTIYTKNINYHMEYYVTRHGKISQLVEIGQECLYVLSARSCFLINNVKCKQLSNWSELELSTADRVFPQLLHSVSFTVISIRDCE